MENTPLSGEDDSDKKESTAQKNKSAETIGSFVVESKPSRPKPSIATEKHEGFWQRLTNVEEKPQITAGDSKETTKSEAEAPLESLSKTEKQVVERELILAQQASPEDTSEITGPEIVAAEAAAQEFRNKIINEGKDSDEALSELEAADMAGVEVELTSELPAEFTEAVIEISRQPSTESNDDPAAASTFPSASTASSTSSASRTAATSVNGAVFGASAPVAPVSVARPGVAPVTRTEHEPVYYESHSSNTVSGIIDYLIGRRRGRIKTEKRLLPIQKKLEKQVTNLQQQLQEKEVKVRTAAIERVRAQTRNTAEQNPAGSERQPAHRTEALEANQLHGKSLPAERIGKVIIGETNRRAIPEASKPNAGAVEKHVETLSRNDLLLLSEKIIVEGTSLRKVYETHLISERGLRRLVAEHLKGGNLQKALRRELVEHEIDFERDPVLRDHGKTQSIASPSTTLQSLLEQVNIETTEGEEPAVLKAREKHQKQELQRQHSRSRTMDVSLATIIAFLLALVIYLFITHN